LNLNAEIKTKKSSAEALREVIYQYVSLYRKKEHPIKKEEEHSVHSEEEEGEHHIELKAGPEVGKLICDIKLEL